MPTIVDRELGEIVIVRTPLARRMRASMTPRGLLKITAPAGTPLTAIKLLLRTSRSTLRQFLQEHADQFHYDHDQPIGKSHQLMICSGTWRITTTGTTIIVTTPNQETLRTHHAQQAIRDAIIKALRKEARSYLPRRLQYLAAQHGFTYKNVRLTHASGRWGSCSSRGTISLNIALMNLPFALLDYVLIHELCHTRHMNHSTAFWREVAAIDPAYRQHRDQLKTHAPHL